MRVFLTGGTGYVGSAVLEGLLRAQHQVTALVRDPEKGARLSTRGVVPVVGELGSPGSFVDKIDGTDAIVHASFEASPRGIDKDREAIDTLLSSLEKRDGGTSPTFVYTSGVWILGNTTKPADEESPIDPVAHVAWRPDHEQRVLAAESRGIRAIVVRPGIVYGGARGIISDLLKDALNGMMRVIGPGKNRWPTVYWRDVGDLYAKLLDSPDARGVFHANDETDERVNDIVEAIAGHLSQRPEIRHMPMAEARRRLGTRADALALDQRVRSPRARALGWAPTLSSVTANVPRLFEEFRRSRA